MPDLDYRIALARRHVEEGRRIVERQRARIASGRAGADAGQLLEVFQQSLAIFEQDLASLLKEPDIKIPSGLAGFPPCIPDDKRPQPDNRGRGRACMRV